MPGYVLCHGYCFGCGALFSFNPMRVPSIRPTPDHPREPVCRTCVDNLNRKLTDAGMAPISVFPDAYDGCAEEELW
jgi:hypothetical protein